MEGRGSLRDLSSRCFSFVTSIEGHHRVEWDRLSAFGLRSKSQLAVGPSYHKYPLSHSWNSRPFGREWAKICRFPTVVQAGARDIVRCVHTITQFGPVGTVSCASSHRVQLLREGYEWATSQSTRAAFPPCYFGLLGRWFPTFNSNFNMGGTVLRSERYH